MVEAWAGPIASMDHRRAASARDTQRGPARPCLQMRGWRLCRWSTLASMHWMVQPQLHSHHTSVRSGRRSDRRIPRPFAEHSDQMGGRRTGSNKAVYKWLAIYSGAWIEGRVHVWLERASLPQNSLQTIEHARIEEEKNVTEKAFEVN